MSDYSSGYSFGGDMVRLQWRIQKKGINLYSNIDTEQQEAGSHGQGSQWTCLG